MINTGGNVILVSLLRTSLHLSLYFYDKFNLKILKKKKFKIFKLKYSKIFIK